MSFPGTVKRLKISELAERAGVTIPTIRHYLLEGLLPQPVKTGKTMAYYDPGCIDRVRLIKRLQRERFLPIEVIKRVIDAGEVFGEESEIGQILTKSNSFQSRGSALTVEELTAATGYSALEIRRLQRNGIIVAKKEESGPCYDALDAELVKMVQKQEAAGLSLTFTIKTIRMYAEAVEAVVSKNTQRVLVHLITDVPVENMGRVLTEMEDSLDALVVLLRQKCVRRINEAALGGLNAMAKKLDAMVFFPVPGRHLPDIVPADPVEKIFFDFCKGDYPQVLNTGCFLPGNTDSRRRLLCDILSLLCLKDVKAAVHLVETHLPEPGEDPLSNSFAALTYVYAAAFSAGIMGPVQQMKKAWPFLEKSHVAPGGSKLDHLLTRYVCGAIYTAFPEIFGLKEKGLALLALAGKATGPESSALWLKPQWMAMTLTEEIMPAMEARINRLLVRQYVDDGIEKTKQAKEKADG